jgi:peptide/nickel transport system substrate-binding protein
MRRWLLALAALLAAPAADAQQRPLRASMNIELQILDPIVTTATVTRAFGYMVYDTLVAMDSAGNFRPQMLAGWTVSDDRLTWTFKLRPGLAWHDGAPVTAEDCVASIKRWAKGDAFGQRMMAASTGLRAVDAATFELTLAKPFAFVIEALGKPNMLVPFMMPARMAEAPHTKQNTETIGSGPFTFRREDWRPGDRAPFRRNPAYVPRAEPADGLAGGKIAGVEAVEFVSMPDPATRVTALQAGSVDYLEVLPFDYIERMRANRNVRVVTQPPMAHIMGGLSVNNTQPPLDNPKVRRALQMALDQTEILGGIGLPPDMSVPFCQAVFLCGGPYETDAGTAALRGASPEKAKALLAASGYAGERIVLLHSTDSAMINPISLVLIDQIKRAGFNLEVVASDYSSMAQRRLKKDPLDKGGWSLMPVVWSGYDMVNPLSHYATSYSCTGNYPGWNCDPGMPELVARFEVEADPDKRKALAREMQIRVLDQAPQMFLGQFAPPTAYRAELDGVLRTGVHTFWNIRRGGS